MTDVTPLHAMRSYSVNRESDVALVERVRAGDRDAFDVVHATYNARLFGFLVRLARSRDVAEDLLEETWRARTANRSGARNAARDMPRSPAARRRRRDAAVRGA